MQNTAHCSPPELLLVYHTLPTLEIQRCTQDLTRKVCERVLGIVYNRGGDVDIVVRLLDELLVSERRFEGVFAFLSVSKTRSRVVARMAASLSVEGAASVRAAARGRTGAWGARRVVAGVGFG